MTDQVTEEWRPVVGYEGWYSVSSFGRVRRDRGGRGTRKGKILKIVPSIVAGLLRAHVNLWKDGVSKSHQVHPLVCRAFHGPRPSDKHEVAHWDRNGLNNTEGNLRWATRKENCADKVRHGTQSRGETSPGAKLTEDQAREIRRRWAEREPLCSIAADFGVAKPAVSRIGTGQRWAHLAAEVRP